MYNFRVSNPSTVKRLLEKNRDDIKEITLSVKDPDVFLSDMLTDLQDDTSWPVAVAPSLIVDPTDEEQIELRAKHIVEMNIRQDVFGLNFLDFGCGDGHVAVQALERGARKVVAYDIKAGDKWTAFAEKGNIKFTDKWKDVVEAAPYDYILLYDVLDHIMDREPKDVLADLSKLLAKDGFISIRCHPWIGRHGSHLYTQLNKAFAHVIFDEDKLRRFGYESLPVRKIIHPMLTYKNWIQKAGLSIVEEDKTQEPVEEFFLKNELFMGVIKKHFKNSPLEEYKDGHGDWGRVLSFQFCDFILAR